MDKLVNELTLVEISVAEYQQWLEQAIFQGIH